MKLLTLAACTLAIGLSGCTTLKGMTPEQAKALIDSFHAAGCGGSVALNGGAATGQLGGAAHIDLTLNGSCPSAPAGVVWGGAPEVPH